MNNQFNNPLLVFGTTFFVLWLTAWVGSTVLRRRRSLDEEVREDFGVIRAATLTLLGLLIGFSFSMATSRYDQRKIYEEEEANAIGTEFVRAGLLPPADTTTMRALLRNYLDQRVAFYMTSDEQQLREINSHTAQLQSDLWSAVQAPATAQPSPIVALAVSGMNDVLTGVEAAERLGGVDRQEGEAGAMRTGGARIERRLATGNVARAHRRDRSPPALDRGRTAAQIRLRGST